MSFLGPLRQSRLTMLMRSMQEFYRLIVALLLEP